MPINFNIAKTAKEIDEVFKVRHKVFVEEDNLLSPTKDKRLVDRFDAMPTTKSLIVVENNNVVGSLRLSLDSEIGLPADEHFDFRKYLPQEASILHIGMLCISKEHRNPRTTSNLMLMASYYGMSKKTTHVVAPINPQIANLLKRIGFVALADEFFDPILKTPILPLILDVTKLNDFFTNFIMKNQLQDFIGDYERSFYKKGEYIISAGDKGDYAYVLIEGDIYITLPDSHEKIAELNEGEVFGELALLTDEVRSTNVIAQSNVQVMKLSKDIFIKYFYNQPEQAQKLLKLMGTRTQNLIKQLQSLKISG